MEKICGRERILKEKSMKIMFTFWVPLPVLGRKERCRKEVWKS